MLDLPPSFYVGAAALLMIIVVLLVMGLGPWFMDAVVKHDYVRISHDGDHIVVTPLDAVKVLETTPNREEYTATPIRLSRKQFRELPESDLF